MSMAERPKPKPMAKLIGCLVSLIVLGAVGLGFALYYLLPGQGVANLDDLNPDEIRSFRVYFLNRKELDEGDDIGPYLASRADYDKLLQPLRELESVAEFPNAKGPWLGEYRILLKNGRKSTIKIYWARPSESRAMLPAFGAVSGSTALIVGQYSRHLPPTQIRAQIGPNKSMGYGALHLVELAEEAARRGTPQ